jgi:hypothetical protein
MIGAGAWVSGAFADDNPLRFSSDTYKTNLKTRIIEASGNVKVRLDDMDVTGQHLEFDPSDGDLEISGGFTVENPKFRISGDRFEYNLKTKNGVFYDASLKHQKGVFVRASELRVISDNNFQIFQGSMTTCEDCPAAWSFVGAYIDLTVEGYAEIHHALLQISDLPIFYFPILVLPVKMKRQSGLLFPSYAYSSKLGPQFAQAFYWAPRPDFDSKFEYRYFTKAGSRIANETRFQYSDRSFVDIESSYVRNHNLPDVPNNRYGIHVEDRYQINPHWTQRWQGEWTSDPRYLQQLERDFDSYQQPVVANQPSLSWQNDHYWALARTSFHQDNLPRDAAFNDSTTGLGGINILPQLIFSQPERPVGWGINAAWDAEWLSLARSREDPDPVTGWIRSGDRATADLRLSTSISPGRILTWDPSVELRGDLYRLDAGAGADPSAARARVSTQHVVSSEFFRIYDSDLGELRALRHALIPSIRWSYAPKDWLKDNPFFHQDYNFGASRGTLDSPRFDLFDPRPKDFVSDAVFTTADDESRLQEHNLLTVGLDTSLVGRFGDDKKRYEKLLRARVAQDFDLRSQSFGLLRLNATSNYDFLSVSFDWIYDTQQSLKTSTQVSLAVEKGDWKAEASHRKSKLVHSVSGALSSKDFWGFNALVSASYDLRPEVNQFVRQRFQFGYKSDSKCWYFTLDFQRTPDIDHPGRYSWNLNPNIGLAINNESLDLP